MILSSTGLEQSITKVCAFFLPLGPGAALRAATTIVPGLGSEKRTEQIYLGPTAIMVTDLIVDVLQHPCPNWSSETSNGVRPVLLVLEREFT